MNAPDEYEPTEQELHQAESDGHHAGINDNHNNPHVNPDLYDAWEAGYKRGKADIAAQMSKYDRSWAKPDVHGWRRVR